MDNTEQQEDFTEEFKQHIEAFSQTSIDEIVNRLHLMLKTSTQTLIDENERETFLIGTLGVTSWLLPNYKGKYGGRWVSLYLFTYILVVTAAVRDPLGMPGNLELKYITLNERSLKY